MEDVVLGWTVVVSMMILLVRGPDAMIEVTRVLTASSSLTCI
jgi:hypothetical protein